MGAQPPQHAAVVPKRVIALRGFDNLNDSGEIGIAHDVAKWSGPDPALPDPFVPIDARAGRRPGIVEMQALKQSEPNHAIEFLPYVPDVRQPVSDGVQMRRIQ